MIDKEMLEREFDGFCKTAVAIFNSGVEEVRPYIFLLPNNLDDPIQIVPIAEDKDIVERLVKALCEKFKPVAGVSVSEAWLAQLGPGAKWDGRPVSERLDRIETLVVALHSRMLSKIRIWKIIHEGSKRKLEDMDTGGFDQLQFRFFGDYFRVDA